MSTKGWEHVTVEATRPRRSVVQATPSKYRAVKQTVDGITFASKAEARRYQELLLLVRAGQITHLVLQPRFELWAAVPLEGEYRAVRSVGCYVADFQYRDQRDRGVTVVEDVKGVATPLYKLKKRLAEACHGIQIKEVR